MKAGMVYTVLIPARLHRQVGPHRIIYAVRLRPLLMPGRQPTRAEVVEDLKHLVPEMLMPGGIANQKN